MRFDLAGLSATERYKLLGGLVVPRPIALVTTRGAEGRVNAAPFSFFNVFAEGRRWSCSASASAPWAAPRTPRPTSARPASS